MYFPIDLIPGAPLPNRAAYRTNPEETKEIERQINQLVSKGLIQVSTSPSAVPVILVPKTDDTLWLCMDCRPINAITVRYRHPIHCLNYMLDELCGTTIFQKLIFVVATIKYEWRKVMSGKPPSRSNLVSMNGW